ncbi:PREDICTED: topless-related protein 2-like [Fragaria vesca subsp. vesca]|uniref:topless-related protein 2-like n=1 Tax=Fragaria vesca subsp. vesca TaxID=101020 RepID=UPI0002C32AC2|nr:PREDICTED: topless-related protein 2-like [Fragaria vesca subsp. vesca]
MVVPNAQRDAIDSIVQYLDRINLKESARMLERESGLFFNVAYFEDCFLRGAFEAAEDYLTGFTGVHDNNFTINVVFELRWHKFLAALNDNNREEARVIIREKLQPLAVYNKDLLGFANTLVNMHNFRMHEAFLFYGEPQYHRMERLELIRMNLNSNPLLHGKLRYAIHSVYNSLVIAPPIPAALAVPAASLVPIGPAPRAAPQPLAVPAGPRNYTTVTPSWFPRPRRN